jgi:zinc protease
MLGLSSQDAAPEVAVALDRVRQRAADPAERPVHVGSHPFGPVRRVERFRLANGLELLALRDDAAPVVAVETWIRVGSRFERHGKTGISHLFEHLMFGATKSREHGAFDRLLEEAGAETNAATFLDWTHYHDACPTEALGLALELEADRLQHLVLGAEQVASEKEVVANERRQRVDDDVEGAVSELLWSAAFREHGYGIPTIGWMADIEGFTPADCEAFYATYYAPNNALLVVAGDFDWEELLGHVQRLYGPMRASEVPIEDVHPEPPQTEERRLEVEKPTATEKVALGWKAPALGDADHAPLAVLIEILFGGAPSRAHRALVRRAEVATEVRGWVGTFRDPSLVDVYLSAREGIEGEDLLARLDAIVDEVRREPPSDAELARAQARLELESLEALETLSGKAESIGFHDVVLGDPAAVFTRLEAIRRVTRSDLLRVARRWLVSSARTVVLVRAGGEQDELDDDDEDEGGLDDGDGRGDGEGEAGA